ncbi:MAG TPA: FIST N-terminal domain-containing protein [Polyangia bacterium]
MATTAAVAKTDKRDARRAGRDVANRALAALGRPPDLLLLFSTAGYHQAELVAGIADVDGDTPLAGCSGEGVITQEGSDESAYAAVLMAVASDVATFDTFAVEGLAKDPRGAGEAIAARVRSLGDRRGRCLLLFPDGITGNSTVLLTALQERLPHPLTIAGGTAGDLAQFERTFQYHDRRVLSDAVSMVLIGGDVDVETTVSHGCEPIGSVRTVTRSDGGNVYEIDGRSAWSVFKEYLDGDPVDLSAADSVHLSFGERLPTRNRDGYGEYVMRTPFGLDRESGALFFPGSLAQGSKIQMMRRDPDRIRDSARRSARELAARRPGRRPNLVLHFDCAGRGRIIFGERATEMAITPIQEVLGRDLPWLGFHTYGEIAELSGVAYYHNYTVVLLALYDRERVDGRPGAETRK